MFGRVRDISGHKVFVCEASGPALTETDALAETVGAAFAAGAQMVAVPLSRLGQDFLNLSTGIAGALIQRFFNARFRVVIIGDTAEAEAKSQSLRDFIAEANRGIGVWFSPDLKALEARLKPTAHPAQQRVQVWA